MPSENNLTLTGLKRYIKIKVLNNKKIIIM